MLTRARDDLYTAPTLATPRTPGRRTQSGRVAAVSAALGRPLIPWQRESFDVALEVLPDGRPAYRLVIITVQRQVGKSAGLDAVHLADLTYPGRRSWYTAQSGSAAAKRFRNEIAPAVSALPYAEHCRIAYSAGAQGIRSDNGARFGIFAPKEDAIHGDQVDRATVDEAWAFDIAQGRTIEQAIIPAGRTRPDFCRWVISTAGTAKSAWLAELVALGRDTARSGRTDTGVCYIEYSAEGVDPDDIEAIIARHPGRLLGSDDFLRDQFARMPRAEFLRAFGNVWSTSDDLAIPPAAWAETAGAMARPSTAGGVWLGVDAARDESRASIAAAWAPKLAPGLLAVAMVDVRPGISWLETELPAIARAVKPRGVIYDSQSPAAGIMAKLARSMTPTPTAIGWADVHKACSLFLTRIRDRRLVHVPDPDLDAAAVNAAQRFAGDVWAWGRRVSSGPIDPLNSATFAAYRVEIPTGVSGKPIVRAY